MEAVTLEKIARAVHAQNAAGLSSIGDLPVSCVCTDTRKIEPGCLFIGIRGENFDGNDFVEQAFSLGAAAALCERELPGRPQALCVEDTRRALLELAAYYRSLFSVFVAGVTGSVGKTSTKEMIYAILNRKGATLKTEGNFNNEIGMPMTMFRLDSSYQNAVLEMGMSAFGEISALTRVCRPNVGVITNIGVSHMETLGSRENILKAKLEILDGMTPEAPLVLNADDVRLHGLSGRLENPLLFYGIEQQGDVTASDIRTEAGGTAFTIHYYGRSIPAFLPAVGRHNVYNALAGFCVGLVADMPPDQIVRAMKQYKNAGMRQNISEENGVTVIADCYNASPASMAAAIDTVTRMECGGRRICVFGDMLELGAASEEGHLEVGRGVARADIDVLACFGPLSRDIKRGAMMCGMKNIRHFTDKRELAAYLAGLLLPGDIVVYKASRGMQLEDVMKLVSEGRNGKL